MISPETLTPSKHGVFVGDYVLGCSNHRSLAPAKTFEGRKSLAKKLAHHLPFLLVSRGAVNLRRTQYGMLPNWIIAAAPVDGSSDPQDYPS
jgi:hypothetical protein